LYFIIDSDDVNTEMRERACGALFLVKSYESNLTEGIILHRLIADSSQLALWQSNAILHHFVVILPTTWKEAGEECQT
jgi:hypothetical protein